MRASQRLQEKWGNVSAQQAPSADGKGSLTMFVCQQHARKKVAGPHVKA